ncbi:MAG: hypothetical protein ACLR5I_14535, partial [Odoribacter splanchnicus]
PLGYEPNELPLLHPAIPVNTFCIAGAKIALYFFHTNFSLYILELRSFPVCWMSRVDSSGKYGRMHLGGGE